MIHINKKEKICIDAYDEYKLIPEELYEKIGIAKKDFDQTLFVFMMRNDDIIDSFNITKDAVYPSNEVALTKGVELNIALLKTNQAKILSIEEIKLPNGEKARKVISEFQSIKVQTLFKSINGLLICMGFGHNEDLISRQEYFQEMFASVKYI